MNPRKAGCILAAFLIASVPLVVAQGTYTQFDDPIAVYGTHGISINTAGDIVGNYLDSDVNAHGFLLGGGIYTTIDYPGATDTYLTGINDVGQIVGWIGISSFLYDVQTQTFTTIIRPFASQTSAFGINNAGAIAGTYFHVAQHGQNSRWIGFELVGSKYYDIFPPNVDATFVMGISASGKAVGYSTKSRSSSNFFYYRERYKDLPLLPFGATVNGINPAGNAVVGYYSPSPGVTAGFLYQNNILTTLQFPGSTYTIASGINASGEVVGLFGDATTLHGFTWTPPGDSAKK